MDRNKLIAALIQQYRMTPDLAGRVADNLMQPGGATHAYQAAVDQATAPPAKQYQPALSQIKSAADDIATQAGYGNINPGAYDRNRRRVDPRLADIVAQGNAPVPQPSQSQGENYLGPVTLDKRSEQLKAQQLQAMHQAFTARLASQYGYDPASAAQVSAALLSPMANPHPASAGMFSASRKGGSASKE